YTLTSGLTATVRGLTVAIESGNPVVYATTADAPTKLVRVVDTGAASAFTTLVTAATNTAFRGVALVPDGTPAITTQPQDQTIPPGLTASLTVVATGPNLSYQWYTGTGGTTTNPIGGAMSASYMTPILSSPVRYWVRVSNVYGHADSNTAFVHV